MIPNFAHILELCDRQVLVRTHDDEQDQCLIIITFKLPNGTEVSMKLGFGDDEAKRNTKFTDIAAGDLDASITATILDMDAKMGKPEDVEPAPKLVLPPGLRRR